MFDFFVHAKKGLQSKSLVGGLEIPVSVIYGSNDWMSQKAGYDLVAARKDSRC